MQIISPERVCCLNSVSLRLRLRQSQAQVTIVFINDKREIEKETNRAQCYAVVSKLKKRLTPFIHDDPVEKIVDVIPDESQIDAISAIGVLVPIRVQLSQKEL